MKTRVLNLIISMLLGGTLSVFAGNKTEEIYVNGKCDMCKSRIETAAKTLSGIESAKWDKDSKKLTVTYDEEKVSMQQIQTSIAMVGHDTELFSASEKRYSELPGCCSYNRGKNRKIMIHDKSATTCSNNAVTSSGCEKDKTGNNNSCCEN